MVPILTIFGPKLSQRRDLFFEKFSNNRHRHRGIIVVVIVAVVVGRFWVASITGTSLLALGALGSAIGFHVPVLKETRAGTRMILPFSENWPAN